MIQTARNLVRSHNLWIFAALCVCFWSTALISNYATLNVVLQCVTLSVAVAVLIAYREPGIDALQKREVTREDHLILGISLAWLGVFLRSVFIVLWRIGFIGDNPTGTINSDWVNFFNFMILLGGVLHVTAPGALNGKIPPKSKVLLGGAFGFGALLASLLLVFASRPL